MKFPKEAHISKIGQNQFDSCPLDDVVVNTENPHHDISQRRTPSHNVSSTSPTMEQHAKPTTALFDVYLRLRPSAAVGRERFLDVEHIESQPVTHITIKPPADDHRKRAVERFAFTRVLEECAGQRELFESTGTVQLVEGVLGATGREGRDGLVATLGVTGSGKVGICV